MELSILCFSLKGLHKNDVLSLKMFTVQTLMKCHLMSSADPEVDRGSGPPVENHKLYGFL